MPPAKKKPSLEEIEALYHLPIAEAAQRLGICKTLLKQVCRKLNSKHLKFHFSLYFNSSRKMALQEIKIE